MEQKIREFLKNQQISLFGFAKTEGLKTYGEIRLLPYAISIGFKLLDTVLETIVDRPTLIYKHHYRIVNNYLDQVALRLSRFIEDNGYSALPIPASQLIDWEKQLGHLSHREIARRAGLGWIGRSGLLVNPKYGARVRYVSVLTDLNLKISEALEFGCKDCYQCLPVCPAKAISNDGVDAKVCYQKLREFSKIRGIGQYICGICVKVCYPPFEPKKVKD